MSQDAYNIIRFMCHQLSTCKYAYKSIVEGCYEAAINNYSMAQPAETKNYIVNKVINIFKKI